MGNKASSPLRTSERSSRRGNNASPPPRGELQRNGVERSTTRTSPSASSVTAGDPGVEDDDADDMHQANTDREIRPVENRTQQQEMSWYQMAKAGYQELVNAIIRPPRARYEVEALGPTEFEFVGKAFKRVDFRLLNDRGHVLECSHWQPDGWRRAEQLPCIVYMHGNSSARVEALPQLTLALSLGTTLVAFDFAGSGKSGGEHVSLGYFERDDLKAVIEHLRKSGQVSTIALWGRSMGAATALLHGDRDPSIAALVLDSAFADLTQLAEEMVERGREAGLTVPGIVVKMVMRMIRGTVTKTAHFNVRDLCPIKHADRTFIPALFVAALADDFIKPHHSKQICEAYAGDKNFITVEGDHNSPRPSFLFDSVYIFLQRYLQVPLDWGLDRESTVMGSPPWHYSSDGASGGAAAAAAAAMFGAAAARNGAGGLHHPDYVDFEWDGIELDDIGVDGNPSVGMTRERQAEFQTALFHMLAQERRDQAPVEAAGSGVSERTSPAAPAGGDSSTVAGTVESDRPSSLGISRREDSDAAAVESRRRGWFTKGKLGAKEKELLAEEEEHAAEAVAAVAAALRVSGATTATAQHRQHSTLTAGTTPMTPTRALHYATPNATTRPAMAPFSVSDTSDFEDTISPGDVPSRWVGSGRLNNSGIDSLAEWPEMGEGGDVGVFAEFTATSDAPGEPMEAAGEAFAPPLSPDFEGKGDKVLDAAESSRAAVEKGETGPGDSGLENCNAGKGGEFLENSEARPAVGARDEAGGDVEQYSLSGDSFGWREKRAGGIGASRWRGRNGHGTGDAENGAAFAESSRPEEEDLDAAYADSEWSCPKCTLKNNPAVTECVLCEAARSSE